MNREHEVDPISADDKQVKHAERSGLDKVSSGQVDSVYIQALAPSTDSCPGGHCRHLVVSTFDVYVPAAQLRQDCDEVLEYVPTGHSLQLEEPAAEA